MWSVGLPVSRMTAAQKTLLRHLLDTHLSNMPEEVAAERAKQLYATDFDQIFFAWTGSLDARSSGTAFACMGRQLLIEHDHSQPVSGSIADKTPNHIHDVAGASSTATSARTCSAGSATRRPTRHRSSVM